MNQAVAAQDQIDPRQGVITHIDSKKPAAEPGMQRGVLADQLDDNVAADVVDRRSFYQPHPIEVTARQIQNRVNAEIIEESFEAGPQDARSQDARAGPGSGLGISPGIRPIDLRED